MDPKTQLELAEELVGKGVITADQLAVAQVSQKNLGKELTDILVARGYVSQEILYEAMSQRSGANIASLKAYAPTTEMLEILTPDFINGWTIIPYKISDDKLIVASATPLDSVALEEVKAAAGKDVDFVLAAKDEISYTVHKFFSEEAIDKRREIEEEKLLQEAKESNQTLECDSEQVESSGLAQGASQEMDLGEELDTPDSHVQADNVVDPGLMKAEEVDEQDASETETEESKSQELAESNAARKAAQAARQAAMMKAKRASTNRISHDDLDSTAIIEMVDKIIQQAVMERASDLHIEPKREKSQVRIRVDGILESLVEIPKKLHQKVLSRIKIMGKLDVAENRLPQDGSASLSVDEKEVDLRIATYPTTLGEAAAIRISTRSGSLSFADMGLSERDQATFEKLINKPHGIFLVTGPTGSGKTTSLYTALNSIDRNAKHVLTVEDPAESEIEGVVQSQINPKAGVTFPIILRGMLREDPDVIMVGEIRDQETAEISLRAAMTGHLVLSTLHTNSAIGAIARLQDLGLDTYLISSTLAGVMAQRLVRRICQDCKQAEPIEPHVLTKLGPKAKGLVGFIGGGCEKCHHRGYLGRIGIFEVIPIDDEFKILINNRAPEVRLLEKAASLGSKTMLEDGIEKIAQGLTSVEEVMKVC